MLFKVAKLDLFEQLKLFDNSNKFWKNQSYYRTCTKVSKLTKEILLFFRWEKITSESRNFRRVQTILLIYLHKKSATGITYYSALHSFIQAHSQRCCEEGVKEIDSYLCEWIFKQKCKLFWGLSYSDLNSTFASSEESSLREINEWIERMLKEKP